MTPQNFYARHGERTREEVDDGLILELIRNHRLVHPRLGVRKLQFLIEPALKEAGVNAGRDHLFELLRKEGLLVPKKRSGWPKTTQYRPYLPHFKNRIKGMKVVQINQVWITDITFIRTQEDFLYLFLLSDKFSRKVLGYELSDSLDSGAAVRVLKRALKGVKEPSQLTHHSDRGCQYACHKYVKVLQDLKVKISMTEINHCAENAQAERVNGILKQEYDLDQNFETKAQARAETPRAIYKYNELRPHGTLKMKTPAEVHRMGI
jgi:putative transposase